MGFDAKYVEKELEGVDARIMKPVDIYLIGGVAMSFRGLKETTKDIDIVFKNDEAYNIFKDALFGAQYHEQFTIRSEYENLEAMKMYENKDGFHLDLFVGHVLGKLDLSPSMVERAQLHKKYGNLTVYLISKEDIFLFKGLASEGRIRDLDDMRVLYPGLDWDTIKQELKSQKRSKELTGWFVSRLKEFTKVHKLDVPILNELEKA